MKRICLLFNVARGAPRAAYFVRVAGIAAIALGAPFVHAQSRGNALQTLPRVAPPPAPKVNATVDNRQTQAMETVLSKTIKPTSIRIEGVKSIPFAAVSARFASFVGKPTTVQMMIAAANDVTKMYQDAGYALSFAFIPAQDFANGVVRVVAVEGYVSSIAIDGNVGNAESKIRAVANHLLGQRPLRRDSFERYTALLGQLPGLKVQANIAPPAQTDGATQLKLTVERKKFGVSTGLSFNQPGIQGLFNVTENGMLSLGEQLSVSALEPRGRDGQTYYGANYTQPIGSDGFTVKLDASRFRSSPRDTLGLPNDVQRTVQQDKIGITASYPIILSNTRSLSVDSAFYGVTNQDQYTNKDTGAYLGLRSQARVLQASVNWVSVSDKIVRRASLVVGKGFDALGASKEGYSNVPGTQVSNPIDLSFVRVGGSASQTNQLPFGLATVASTTGQYSAQTLPSSEQITFGAQRFALAYEPGEAAGDKGWAGSLELNRGFNFTAKYLKSLVPYVSYAIATTYVNNNPQGPARLQSIALGMRVSDSKYYSLDLSVAKPVGDAPVESHSRTPRINATFSYQLD
jgi:hemolysin activation/secretion protein